MGKTKLFGRPTSKISHRSDGAEEASQFVERFRTPGPASEARSRASTKLSSGHQPAAATRYAEEKLGRRKQIDKAKLLAEKTNSLKRRKKHETVRTMAQNLPRDYVKDSASNGNDVSRRNKSCEPAEESDAESIYESRKLLIRQIQGQIAKQVHEERDSVSEYDSWSDLEDNFALAYEPIPLNIKMETWRRMSKKDILRKVNSKKVRKDFEYLTHGEILVQIEKMQLNARYLSSKFGINHLMPHLEHGDRMQDDSLADNGVIETETEVDQSEDDEVSVASFVSGKEIYLSRAEILNKIHKVDPEKRPGVTRVNKTPITKTSGAREPRRAADSGGGAARKQRSQHDSWSSRASSILKDPEAIYVSRVELLKKISVTEEPAAARSGKYAGVGDGKEAGRKSASPPGPSQERHEEARRERRRHDSWSSRASSILAAMEADTEVDSKKDAEESVYMSRVELLKHLQLKSLEALSAASEKSHSQDSDSDTASTVKSGGKPGAPRKWLSQKLQFERDMISAIRDNYALHENNAAKHNNNKHNNSNNNNNNRAPSRSSEVKQPRGGQGQGREEIRRGGEPAEPRGPRVQEPDPDTDWDSCSCMTCHTCQQSDCSCSDISASSRASKSSHSSDGSVETIVDAQERVIKHSDIYIINGSEVSKASSKASSKSKISKKSSNYDPLPLNGIDKIRQRKLTEEEIERERCQEKEENIRRLSTSEKPSRDIKRLKSKEVKGSVKSRGSWTNEEFAKLYEPVSADDLKMKKQVKDLKQQLKTWTPELGKTVDKINTVRRREVIRQLKAAVASNIDLDTLSEEELGKHLDLALHNLNLGNMYVPMEKNPSNSKAVSRENTDYDTFGSIDSLIFEPKLPTHEDIAEAQEEITQSFEYLENEQDEDDGHVEMNVAVGDRHPYNSDKNNNNNINIHEKVLQFEKPSAQLERRSPKHEKNALAVGRTTFAERVKLFQSLGGGQERRIVTAAAATQQLQQRDAAAELQPGPQATTTWLEQARTKRSDSRSGRESSASATSVSTNSSGSTVIYNVEVVAEDEEEDEVVKKTGFRRRGSTVEAPAAGAACSVCGECKSIVSESCSCYTADTYEDCSCVLDCSECGTTETLTRGIQEEEEEPARRRVVQQPGVASHIPIVGNLRRASREHNMNIEKARQKKGFIAEDEEEPARAPSVESGAKMPAKLREKLSRHESFQKLQKRNQFRSISPDEQPDDQTKNYQKSGLLVEVEDGVPLIYQDEHRAPGDEDPDSKCLESPKGKGSEMGDSGISSDPASISPKSSSSGSSGQSHTAAGSTEEAARSAVPGGGKKRDTMIRELKTKLKERFPSDTIEERRSSSRAAAERSTASRSGTIQSAEVGPKLNKIFTALLSSEAGPGPRESPVSGLLRPHYRNGSFTQEEEEPDLASDTECDSSVYDPSLPPGLEHQVMTRSPPPAPPPTATGGKRGSIASHSYTVTATPPGPSPAPSNSRLSPAERREIIYGPGGVFGPTGVFSTPEISRYPEATPQQTKRISFADMVDGKSDQSGFAEDRSDKSQYVCNTVIAAPQQSPARRASPPVPRVQETKVAEAGEAAWVQEKQKRMLNWINRSQVALGARVLGKSSS